jgi:hypothetical protein
MPKYFIDKSQQRTALLAVYIIDDDNFDSLRAEVDDGMTLAVAVWDSIKQFLRSTPSRRCGICKTALRDRITFVVMRVSAIELDGVDISLTSAICETCAQRHDLDAELEKVIRRWLPSAVMTAQNPHATRH